MANHSEERPEGLPEEPQATDGQPSDAPEEAHSEEVTPVDEAHDTAPDGDALAQAEAILNAVEDAPEGEPLDGALVAELKTDLQRLQAEYVNYRRRVERDRSVARDQAVNGVINSLLPVLDDIDAARQAGDLAEGPFASIANKLEAVLKAHGLERIDETGVDFNPTVHEALIQQPGAEVTSDTVSQVLRAGYRNGDRVLRAAQVIVSVPE